MVLEVGEPMLSIRFSRPLQVFDLRAWHANQATAPVGRWMMSNLLMRRLLRSSCWPCSWAEVWSALDSGKRGNNDVVIIGIDL